MIRSVPEPDDRSAIEDAARWRVAVSQGERSPSEFTDWIDADPAHRAAADAVAAGWGLLDHPAAKDAADTVVARLEEERTRRRRFRRRGVAAMAAAAAMVLTVASPWQGRADAYTTSVGAMRTVVLADGSRVSLDGDSAIRVRLGGGARELWLDRGQARFEVAPDARPFSVHAGGRTVVARGTAFDVELVRGQTIVTLVRGHVSVTPDDLASRTLAALSIASGAIALSPGQQLVDDGDGAAHVSAPDVREADAWRTGRLVMANMPLGDAIARINRQSPDKLLLADPALADVRLSGVLSSRDALGFAQIVASHLPLTVSRTEDDEIILARR